MVDLVSEVETESTKNSRRTSPRRVKGNRYVNEISFKISEGSGDTTSI
ncbi:hypothetical protein CRE_05904 [Caenorhabditis remanei]|uniref:Uncharacterized protein n=1 Tax=Caenorhabditis remanei TaxID=31234 RepID=E3MNP3_CAERE|nr:hypothetical protein CRE_05904 [Caenorhabditis remanei]